MQSLTLSLHRVKLPNKCTRPVLAPNGNIYFITSNWPGSFIACYRPATDELSYLDCDELLCFLVPRDTGLLAVGTTKIYVVDFKLAHLSQLLTLEKGYTTAGHLYWLCGNTLYFRVIHPEYKCVYVSFDLEAEIYTLNYNVSFKPSNLLELNYNGTMYTCEFKYLFHKDVKYSHRFIIDGIEIEAFIAEVINTSYGFILKLRAKSESIYTIQGHSTVASTSSTDEVTEVTYMEAVPRR